EELEEQIRVDAQDLSRREAYAKTLPVDQGKNFVVQEQQKEQEVLEEESEALRVEAQLMKYAESQKLSPEETNKLLIEQQKKEKDILWSEKEAREKENTVSAWTKIGAKLRSFFN